MERDNDQRRERQACQRSVASVFLIILSLRMLSLTEPVPVSTLTTTETLHSMDYTLLKSALAHERSDRDAAGEMFPDSIQGVFRGMWATSPSINSQLMQNSTIQVHLKGAGYRQGVWDMPYESGRVTLQLVEEKTMIAEITKLQGYVSLLDSGAQSGQPLASFGFELKGYYLKPSGRLTLYGNYPYGSRVYVDWNNTAESNGAAAIGDELSDTPHLHRALESLEGVRQCVFRFDMRVAPIQVVPSHSAQSNLRASGDGSQTRPVESSSSPLTLTGLTTSRNCKGFVAMNITAAAIVNDAMTTKAASYAIVVTLLCLVQVYAIINQMNYSSTPAALAKVSVLCIWYQAVIDTYLCFGHIGCGIFWEAVFHAFGTAAFFKLVVAMVFELRLMLFIWRARLPQGADANSLRRGMGSLYSRFYCSLLVGAVVLYQLWSVHLFMLFASSYWVPQIVSNVMRDARYPLSRLYLLLNTATRIVIPMYIYICPVAWVRPLFDYRGDVVAGTMLFGWVAIQVVILLAQDKFGARFFIPRMFLARKYDYHREVEQDDTAPLLPLSEVRAVDCVICMEIVSLGNRHGYMATPCDHVFHKSCLEDWMQVKMECPTCRAPLPSI